LEKLPKPNSKPIKIEQIYRKNFFNTIGDASDKKEKECYNKKLPLINKSNKVL